MDATTRARALDLLSTLLDTFDDDGALAELNEDDPFTMDDRAAAIALLATLD